jgi:hypothetical protein
MGRIFWVIGYAWRACRSPYQFTFSEAFLEGWASWEMNDNERGADPMPTPAEALYEDQYEWKYQ